MPNKESWEICVSNLILGLFGHYFLTAKLDTDAVKIDANLWIKKLVRNLKQIDLICYDKIYSSLSSSPRSSNGKTAMILPLITIKY